MKKLPSFLIACSALVASSLLLSCKSENEEEFDRLKEEQLVHTEQDLPGALLMAISTNQDALVKRLLFAGANPNSTDKIGNSALQLACQSQNIAVVDALMAYSPDINLPDKKKQTALYTAIAQKNAALVEKLVKAGAQHQHTDNKGHSPLAYACSLGHADIVQQLLQLGADPNLNVPAGREPLCVALEKGFPEIFTFLLQHKANIQVSTSAKKPLLSHIITTNATAFMQAIIATPGLLSGPALETASQSMCEAIRLGHEEIVTVLLQAGITPAENQGSAIKQAVMSTHMGVAAAVVQASKELDSSDPWLKAALTLAERHKLVQEGILSSDRTVNPKTTLSHWGNIMQKALISAIEKSDAALVKRLLQAGASPYSKGRKGSAIFYAIAQDNEEILRLLHLAGAPFDERNKPHALGEAAKNNATKCADYILSTGVLPDALTPSDREQTPLRRAIENKCIEVAALLINNGADINNVYSGAQPIAFSVINIQSLELLELMIKMGLHPDTYAYETGETLLMRAAAVAPAPIVDLLITSGANPIETNSIGSTPIMYAAAANNLENVQLIQSRGGNLRHRNHLGFDVARFTYENTVNNPESQAAQELHAYFLQKGVIRRGKYPYGRYALQKKATLDSNDPIRAKRNHARMQANRQGAATP